MLALAWIMELHETLELRLSYSVFPSTLLPKKTTLKCFVNERSNASDMGETKVKHVCTASKTARVCVCVCVFMIRTDGKKVSEAGSRRGAITQKGRTQLTSL